MEMWGRYMKINKKNLLIIVWVIVFVTIVLLRNSMFSDRSNISLDKISPLNEFYIMYTDKERERFKFLEDKLFTDVVYYGVYNERVRVSDENEINEFLGVIKEMPFAKVDVDSDKTLLNIKVKSFMNFATSERRYDPKSIVIDTMFVLENDKVVLVVLDKMYSIERIYLVAPVSKDLLETMDNLKKKNKTEIVEEKIYNSTEPLF